MAWYAYKEKSFKNALLYIHIYNIYVKSRGEGIFL